MSDLLAAKLKSLPSCPGCYLFRDVAGTVIYVGKASSLRSRVRSYFQTPSDGRVLFPLLQKAIADVDTVVTESEKEATILEDSLIKQHKPKFNIKLRDDKSYLSLRIDPSQDYPRVELVRRPASDGARYFGPHHSATAARRTLQFVNKHFHLRTCSDADFSKRLRPCLQYHIKRCPAPCVLEVDKALYAQHVQSVLLFLEGRHDEVSATVQAHMKDASERLDFELAAVYRDQLRAVERVREAQRVVTVSDANQDIIGLHRDGDSCELAVLYVRHGRMVDTMSFPMRKVEVPDDEVVASFLLHMYGEDGVACAAIPDEVLVPVLPEGVEGVRQWLSDRKGRKVQLLAPKRGARAKLLQMAQDNAAHSFTEKQRSRMDVERRLEEIQKRLRLRSLPRVIECCDISHLGGRDTVGGLVRMVNGELDRSGYRVFHVRGVQDGDDYGAMHEVLLRRFKRAKEEADAEVLEVRDSAGQGSHWDLPDLLVVDGGKGQLQAALGAARELGLEGIQLVGLAKERENVAGEVLVDRVFLPGQKNGISLGQHSSLNLLAQLRDESHRFSNTARKRLGKRVRFSSVLDTVKGIGLKRKQQLLREFGSLEGILSASDQALMDAGLNRGQVSSVRDALGYGRMGGGRVNDDSASDD